LKEAENLPEVGALVPDNGPAAKTTLISGARGSEIGSVSSERIFAPRPRPPI